MDKGVKLSNLFFDLENRGFGPSCRDFVAANDLPTEDEGERNASDQIRPFPSSTTTVNS